MATKAQYQRGYNQEREARKHAETALKDSRNEIEELRQEIEKLKQLNKQDTGNIGEELKQACQIMLEKDNEIEKLKKSSEIQSKIRALGKKMWKK